MSDKKDIKRVFEAQRKTLPALRKRNASERVAALRAISDYIESHREELYSALESDFRKPAQETDLTEITPVLAEIQLISANLGRWMQPSKTESPLALMGTRSEVRYEPKGRVLIISPWNYPFNLAVSPLIGAIAAGNAVIIKPSELSPATSAFLSKMVSEIFHEDEVAVFEGEVDTAQELLKLPFDHIFFTGSTAVGKIVMKAAAEHLSSVTLELGGKSPVVIDNDVKIKDAGRRVAWGKYLNCGQTCVAPDYVLVNKDRHDEFIKSLFESIQSFYGTPENWKTNRDIARIINKKHYERLIDLLQDAVEKGARISIGGDRDETENYISPTVLTGVTADMKIMQSEIFGPILPVLSVDNTDDAVRFIQERPHPLALYVFSNNEATAQRVIEETNAGGSCINDTILHLVNPHLPFGGVGESGMGNYHGRHSFKTFSHERSVLRQDAPFGGITQVVFPPYSKLKATLTGFMKPFL